MRIGFVIFDGMTSLDFVGFHDAVTRLRTMGFLPGLEWEVVARTPEVRAAAGLTFKPDRVGGSLAGYDLLFLPGGMATRTLKDDPAFVEWVKTARDCPLKVSVCTGALLLGAAGFLEGKTATTHPGAYDLLAAYTPQVSRERIVDEGEVITGGGVSSSIDLGLYLCERLAGAEARRKIQRQMDYPYEAPPPSRRPSPRRS